MKKAKSWKTTSAGLGAFLIALGTALVAQFDGSTETIANWPMVVGAGSVLYGLWSARDRGVTSEQEGSA